MSHLSAHVLDAATGTPARGVRVRLATAAGDPVATADTDDDGRVGELGPEGLEPGDYEVRFETGAYHAARGVTCFHPAVVVLLTVTADQPHYHVPLLLSPFAYTTYRGS